MAEFRQALDGFKILEFTQFVAGPTAGRVLAEMGAEVIKVEFAPDGDQSRRLGVYKQGRSAFYVQHNRGKKSLCLNPKTPEGRAILLGLLAKVDVFLENFAPGVVARMGLGYDDVIKVNPKIVMCSVSAYGQNGPLSNKPGFDYMGAALSGVLSMQGEADGPPALIGVSAGDVTAGMSAATGILAALLHRERSGKGQYIDVSLLDTYFHFHDQNAFLYSGSDHTIKPHRNGNQALTSAPTGLFKAKIGYITIIAITPGQWTGVCRAIGRPELAEHPDFATNPARLERLPQVVKLIEDWLQSLDSDEEGVRRLDAEHVPVAAVLSVEEAFAHPHLRARGSIVKVKDPAYGELEVPASPIRLTSFAPLDLTASYLGQYNREILRDYLGYSAAQIDELEAKGIIRSENR